MKQTKPMLNNIVFGRSMLTKEDPKAIGTEFSNIINNNEPYTGFFSSEAKPVASPYANAKTHDGYPARLNADGTYSTEVSITVTDPRLNNGRATNIPSLWKGQEVSEEEAVANALASGKTYPAFSSIQQAVKAAQTRSDAGGAANTTQDTNKRTANMADVARFAREKGMTIDDAISQLEADGVDVMGQ